MFLFYITLTRDLSLRNIFQGIGSLYRDKKRNDFEKLRDISFEISIHPIFVVMNKEMFFYSLICFYDPLSFSIGYFDKIVNLRGETNSTLFVELSLCNIASLSQRIIKQEI